MKTLKEMFQTALDVQNASNLSGVVHAFSHTMTELRERLPNASTQELNQHPIAILFSSKIASLTHSEDGMSFANAYHAACDMQKPAKDQ